jgi:hypothetical protein
MEYSKKHAAQSAPYYGLQQHWFSRPTGATPPRRLRQHSANSRNGAGSAQAGIEVIQVWSSTHAEGGDRGQTIHSAIDNSIFTTWRENRAIHNYSAAATP